MEQRGNRSKATDYLGFKSVVETRNVLDHNSVDPTREVQFCSNNYHGFRFLNNQIVNEIGLRPPKDKIIQWLKERDFFFVDFNLMCVVQKVGHSYYYPVEVGIVKYSMVNGITEEYHSFIDCGPIPEGCAGQALHNQNEHQIPLFDKNALRKLCFDPIEAIVEKIHDLVTKDKKTLTKDKKFVCFNVETRRTQTYGGLEWLHLNNECTVELPEFSVLSVYDLTSEIAKFMEIKSLTDFKTISDEFNTCSYDFDSELYCLHHDEVYCNNCAIANCRRLAFVFSSLMSRCFGTTPISTKNPKVESVCESKNKSVKTFDRSVNARKDNHCQEMSSKCKSQKNSQKLHNPPRNDTKKELPEKISKEKEENVVGNSTNLVKNSIEEEDQAIVKVLKEPPYNVINDVTSIQNSQRQRMPTPKSLPPGFEKTPRQRPRYADKERRTDDRKNERQTSDAKDDRRPIETNKRHTNKERQLGECFNNAPPGFSRISKERHNAFTDDRYGSETNYKYKTQVYSRSFHNQSKQPRNFRNDEQFEKRTQNAPPGFVGNSHRQQKDYRRSDKNAKCVKTEFSQQSQRQANVMKDERRFGTSVKTVPPGFRGSTECKVNIDSVNDALRNSNI